MSRFSQVSRARDRHQISSERIMDKTLDVELCLQPVYPSAFHALPERWEQSWFAERSGRESVNNLELKRANVMAVIHEMPVDTTVGMRSANFIEAGCLHVCSKTLTRVVALPDALDSADVTSNNVANMLSATSQRSADIKRLGIDC